ncbi:hypothetical protein vBAspPH44_2 [Alteromonas phage vB_AspP-H4/4]|uniref:Uncharacterized protein n=1 Tax=Alteromonas phage vB_AspP-H4/4 TaxID=2928692 RepID=A0A220YL42_9CAUD|nr:hypothetical protein HOR85_gp02 [Alteromonas phage vB_AspP-H4/4]ASL24385.1 hypothetical protein vBAspPH44_2 [Alteromonas phage vB_AspP-H4/4]
MIKLNKEYKVKDKTVMVSTHVTANGKKLVVVNVNRTSCFVGYDDVMRKGIIKALSNLRMFNKKLTVSQYSMIGSAIHSLYLLRGQTV